MDLKRYKLSVSATQYMGISVLRQNSTGEWVNYHAVAKEITRLESIIKSQNNDMAALNKLNNRLMSPTDRSVKACSEDSDGCGIKATAPSSGMNALRDQIQEANNERHRYFTLYRETLIKLQAANDELNEWRAEYHALEQMFTRLV